MGKVYAQDPDTVIRFDTKVDVSAANLIQIHWERDDGTTGIWAATPDAETPTKINYTKTGNEVAGTYTFQSYVGWVGTGPILGESVLFTFYDKYK